MGVKCKGLTCQMLQSCICSIIIDQCFNCGDTAWMECSECRTFFATKGDVVYFCDRCAELAHGKPAMRDKHDVHEVAVGFNELDLLSVICIETSHYICFTRSEERWVFFDSMANQVSKYSAYQCMCTCTVPG